MGEQFDLRKVHRNPTVYTGAWTGYWPDVAVCLEREMTKSGDFSPLDLAFSGFRGIGIERLAYALKHSVDVEPADSVIWTAELSKALEYGDPYVEARVVLVFDNRQLQPSFRRLPQGTPESEIHKVQTHYPNRFDLKNGDVWLTRLTKFTSADTSYEAAYGKWIPGSPHEALRAIWILGRTQEEADRHFLEARAFAGLTQSK